MTAPMKPFGPHGGGPMDPGNPLFKPLNNGWGIQPMGPSPRGGDMHDTFRVDPLGNISGGHTTVQVPDGQKIRLPW